MVEEFYLINECASCLSVAGGSHPRGGGGGLRVTDPNDVHRSRCVSVTNVTNGHGVYSTSTPRRHTVTVGGMDLEMANQNQQKVITNKCLIYLDLFPCTN